MSLNKNCGKRTSCPDWTSGLKAMALMLMAFVAMTFSSTVLAQGFHGITFSKGCVSPTAVGSPYFCRYGIGNVGGDSGNGSDGSVDTLEFFSLTDIVHAAPDDVLSGEILPLLFLSVQEGNPTCTPAGLPGAGNTQCTLPPGSSIVSDDYSFYIAQPDDPDPLSDTATLGWRDTCDSGANNCPLGDQSTTSSSQAALTCADCDDGDACTADSCDEVTSECVNDPTDCDDNNACTADSCDPVTGECVNDDNVVCDDLNACTDDFCDPLTGECVSVDNGESCEPVPTLSVWGLVAMILTMLGLGSIIMRRRFLS